MSHDPEDRRPRGGEEAGDGPGRSPGDPGLETELTPAEREALAALPRVQQPPAHLEERVVGALRAGGLLGPRRRPATGWLVAAAAAAVALFAAGTATGQWLAARGTERMVQTVLDGDALARSQQVQEAGSAYVRAVARLADLAEGDDTAAVDPGVQAAHAALRAAALELARLRPDDPTIALVLAVLEEARAAAGAGGEGVRTTFWF